jgi:anaerobic ribonucleoside-triphosphate reductase activating protein
MLSCIDVLVDGPFIEELKDVSLKFRGSSNQRLIDLNKTRSEGRVVLLPLR